MTTSNAATDKAPEKTGAEKSHEKLAEKRRALGRGLESLLPGPRVVPAAPTLPQSARKDGAPTVASSQAASSQFPVPSSQGTSSLSSGADIGPFDSAQGRVAGTPVAPPNAVPETLEALQAVASGQTADGETVFLLGMDQIDHNPYQTRREFDQEALRELASSIQVQGVLQPVVVDRKSVV